MSSTDSDRDVAGPSDPACARKRAQHPETWKKNMTKKQKILGNEYTSHHSGKLMAARKIGPPCSDGCFNKITMPIIRQVFEEFWGIGDYEKQNAFLQKVVSVVPVKRHRKSKTPDSPGLQRQIMLAYTVIFNNVTYPVCRAGFLSVYGLNRRRVENAEKKVTPSGAPKPDMRGRHATDKVSSKQVELVVKHISSIPVVSSHYTRAKSPHRQYLINVSRKFVL